MSPFPVIDLGQEEVPCARAVQAACEEHGFFYVSHHGVPDELRDAAFAAIRALFALPLEAKQALLADANNRGWTPFGEETLDPPRQTAGDTKEGYYIGREVPADSPEASLPLHGPNVWPPEQLLPGFRATMSAYFDAMDALGRRLLRLLALALGLPAEHFDEFFDKPMLALRPLRYAPQVSKPEDGVFGAGAHTDYGMLTLLTTDEVPGLQVHVGGAWVDVAPLRGCFIVNLGDMLERWTNGRFKSTLHRVINAAGAERFSMPFFFEPCFDARVECLPQCCSPSNPPAYPPTTAGEHLLAKYAETHAGYTGPKRVGERKGGGSEGGVDSAGGGVPVRPCVGG